MNKIQSCLFDHDHNLVVVKFSDGGESRYIREFTHCRYKACFSYSRGTLTEIKFYDIKTLTKLAVVDYKNIKASKCLGFEVVGLIDNLKKHQVI